MLDSYLRVKGTGEWVKIYFHRLFVQREIEKMNKIKFSSNRRNQIFKAEAYTRHKKCGI